MYPGMYVCIYVSGSCVAAGLTAGTVSTTPANCQALRPAKPHLTGPRSAVLTIRVVIYTAACGAISTRRGKLNAILSSWSASVGWFYYHSRFDWQRRTHGQLDALTCGCQHVHCGAGRGYMRPRRNCGGPTCQSCYPPCRWRLCYHYMTASFEAGNNVNICSPLLYSLR